VNLLFLGKFVLLSKADRIPFYLAWVPLAS
jgi:hypothetical protein